MNELALFAQTQSSTMTSRSDSGSTRDKRASTEGNREYMRTIRGATICWVCKRSVRGASVVLSLGYRVVRTCEQCREEWLSRFGDQYIEVSQANRKRSASSAFSNTDYARRLRQIAELAQARAERIEQGEVWD